MSALGDAHPRLSGRCFTWPLAGLLALLLVVWLVVWPGALAQDASAVYAEAPDRLLYGTLHAAAFHPEQRALLATAGGVGAVLWDLESGEAVRFLDLPEFPDGGPGRYAMALGFSPDGGSLIALYGDDCVAPPRTALRWNLDDGSATTWRGTESPPGLRADLEGALCQPLWSRSGSGLTFAGAFPGAQGVWTYAETVSRASPSGRLEVAIPEVGASAPAAAPALRVRDEAGEVVAALPLPADERVWSVVFSGDEARVAVLLASAATAPERGGLPASAVRTVVLDLDTSETVAELDGHAALTDALAFGPDGVLTLLHDGAQASRFRLAGGTPERERTVTLALAPDAGQRQLVAGGGVLLAAPGGLGLTLIPLAAGVESWRSDADALRVVLPAERLDDESVAALAGLLDRLAALASPSLSTPVSFPLDGGAAAFDAGATLLAVSSPSAVWLWRFGEGGPRGALAGRLTASDPAVLDALRFGPPGSPTLVGYTAPQAADCLACEPRAAGLRLWNVATGALLLSEPMPPLGTPVALTSERIAAATGLWDARTGALLCGWQPVTAVALGPYLALGNAEGVVSLVDLRSCEALAPLPGHRDRIEELAFSPDGRWLASRSRDGQALLWSIPARP